MTITTSAQTARMARLLVIMLFCISGPAIALARPATATNPATISRRQENPQFSQSSNNNNGPNGVSPQIWIPILVIALVLSGIAILTWSKRSIRRGLASLTGAAAAQGVAVTPGANVREVTAEQLAGTTGRNNSTNNNTGTNGRPRRTRRPRRTPSQVSTTSLPAYAKEPGEQELVIYRGPEDMEDNPILPTTNLVMPPVDEDMDESVHTRNDSQASDYPPAPDSPHDMPLLNQDDEDDDPSPDLLRSPPGEGMPTRRSTETLNTSEGASSLLPVNSRVTTAADPRGEAPPYFEVVDLNDSQRDLANSPSTLSDPSEPRTPPSSSGGLSGAAPRRSAFMSLWHSIGNYSASASSPPQSAPGSSGGLGHTRADSGPSVVSSDSSHHHARENSRSRFSHRASPSGSSSILSPFRTLSRQKSIRSIHSTNNLNSPSLISLNSISAPLTHTVVRTEFTYPKAGPTPEQLKLISSRESFVRFGKPYGPDAIAFAASASRQELVPPPDFDAVSSETNLVRGGPSRLRTDSTSAMREQHDGEHTESPLEGQDPPAGPSNDTDTHLDDNPQRSQSDPSEVHDESPPQAPAEPSETSPSPSSSNSSTAASTPSLPTSSPPTSAPTSPPTTASSSSSQPLLKPHSPTEIPPSSFRAPSTAPFRPESRASSMQSFATAAETLPPSTPAPPSEYSDADSDLENDEEIVASPSTPRPRASKHLVEPTDATITQEAVGTPSNQAGSRQSTMSTMTVVARAY